MSSAVLAAVAFGGAVGSLMRYGAGSLVRGWFPAGSGFPWGTLLVNIVGSALIGVLFAVFLLKPAPEWLRLGLITGLLGGFTTFSAFSLDALEMFRVGSAMPAMIYILLSVLGGLLACLLGVMATRMMLA